MFTLYFECPKCHENFIINGYWNWILRSPFHWFGYRSTKCPQCGQRSYMRWNTITR